MVHSEDTIAALATAPGGAARGIVRISGPRVVAILDSCFCPVDEQAWRQIASPHVHRGSLALAGTSLGALPVDVYLWPGERSYTRQPLAEIHTIGSPPLLSAVLRTLCGAGARLAQPGEFTLRAFLAGRIDLAQAEAVLGVIDARGERDFQRALGQLAGGLSGPLDRLRDELLELTAHLEAGLDFVEEDITFITQAEVQVALDRAAQTVDAALDQLGSRQCHDDLPRVVLAGLPNVGKSSLFNALAPGAAALVSQVAGTTRDYLTATIDVGPASVQLIDTAGRMSGEPDDPVSLASQKFSIEQAEAADLRLLCLDATRALTAWEQQQLSAVQSCATLVVWTKCDQALAGRAPLASAMESGAVETSAVDGRGVDALRRRLSQHVSQLSRDGDSASLTAERCEQSLRTAREHLAQAAELNRTQAGEELIAAEVRLALLEIGTVVGAVYTDDILDRVFSRFCIGK